MKELKITEGEWRPCCEDSLPHYIFVGEESGNTICAMNKSQDFSQDFSDEEVRSNAKLIADAGNTYQKCGMTPSELLANLEESQSSVSMLSATVKRLELEKAELLDKYKEAIEALKVFGDFPDEDFEDMKHLPYTISVMTTDIRKAKQIINQSKEILK